VSRNECVKRCKPGVHVSIDVLCVCVERCKPGVHVSRDENKTPGVAPRFGEGDREGETARGRKKGPQTKIDISHPIEVPVTIQMY